MSKKSLIRKKKRKKFGLWQCVSIKFNRKGSTYAGYIFTAKDELGKYRVAVPRISKFKMATEDMMTERKCSRYMEEKIAEHKKTLKKGRPVV